MAHVENDKCLCFLMLPNHPPSVVQKTKIDIFNWNAAHAIPAAILSLGSQGLKNPTWPQTRTE